MDPLEPFLHRYSQTQSSLRFPNRELPPFGNQNNHNFYQNNAHREHNNPPPLTPLDPSSISFRNHHQTFPDSHVNQRGLEINGSFLGFDRNLDRSNNFLGPGARVFDRREPENGPQIRFGGNGNLQRWDSNFIAEGRQNWDSNRIEKVNNLGGFLDRRHELRGNTANRRVYEEIYQPIDVVGRKRFRESEGCVDIDYKDRGFISISSNKAYNNESRVPWVNSEPKHKNGYRGQKDNNQFESLSSEKNNGLAYVPGFPSTRYDLEFDDVKERKTWFASAAPLKQQKVGEEGVNDRKWTMVPRGTNLLQQSSTSTSYAIPEPKFMDSLWKDSVYESGVREETLLVKSPSIRDYLGLSPVSKMGKGKMAANNLVADSFPTTIKKLPKRTRTLVVVPTGNSKPTGKRKQGHQFSFASQTLQNPVDSKCVITSPRGPLVLSDHRLEKSPVKSAIGFSPKDRPVDLDVSFKSNALVAKEIIVPLSPIIKKKIVPSSPVLDSNKLEAKKKKKKIKGSNAAFSRVHGTGVQESQEPNLYGCSNNIEFDASSLKDPKQLEVLETACISDIGVLDDFGAQSSFDGSAVLSLSAPPKNSAMGSEEAIASQDEGNAENLRNVGMISAKGFAKDKEVAVSDSQFSSLAGRVADQREAISVWTSRNCHHDFLKSNDENCDNTSLLQSTTQDKTAPLSLQVQDSVSEIKSPSKAMDSVVSKARFDRKGREYSPVVSQTETLESLVVPELQFLNSDPSLCHRSSKTNCKDTEQHESFINCSVLIDSLDPKLKSEDVKSDQKMLTDCSITNKKSQLLSQATKPKVDDLNITGQETVNSKTQKSSGANSLFPRHAFFPSQSLNKLKTTPTHFVTPRTWRRTDGTSHSLGQKPIPKGAPLGKGSLKKLEKPHNASYIRKGNSLVRKSTPVAAAAPMVSLGDDIKKNAGLGFNLPIERPKTPSLPETTKLPNFTTNSPQNSPYATTTYPPETIAVSASPTVVSSKVPSVENQGVDPLVSHSETQAVSGEKNLTVSELKQMIYVKPKSNQLVAAPRPIYHDSSTQITEKTSLPSDGYYKKKKNQIVRNITALDSQIKQCVVTPDDGSNSEGQMVPKVSNQRHQSFSKRKLGKVLMKTRKPSKLSLVWTLGGAQSHHEDVPSLQHMKVLPSLFPWKRTIYRRCFMRNMMPVAKRSSLAHLRKLQLSRKRDTIYTRSSNGFSLRKSGVFSIGGSNLKWSKSIEKRSKKASEEATLAVAAVERKKREQNKAISGNITPRERIFRIGSVRYKMDPSKRTLLRILDGKSSHHADQKSGGRIRASFVPTRLLIDNDEYIRIGNGNKLVRDPKRLARILASEKVRWSLHTARLRLAKKQQYCQFFTRFGKCNKDGGKCPYIHDPEKVAVCTKFLNGSCSNVNCKLTHKVIPQRMQDCSYFLQGLCANENCPYRHVNVDPHASVCEGFLKGYCADGDECCKKHSYVCPQFEATGICRRGSQCKLHHPKKKDKCGKRSRHKGPKNFKGRYFVSSSHLGVENCSSLVADRNTGQQTGDIFYSEGRFSDYISLGVDEDRRYTNDGIDMIDAAICESDPSDSQTEDLDALIKPVRLMLLNTTQQKSFDSHPPIKVHIHSVSGRAC